MLINQRGFFPIILGIIVLLLTIGGVAYYITTQNSKPPAEPITLSNYEETNPTIIQQTYPEERVNVGGQNYNATQIIVSAQLFITEENDYSISSSFDDTGSLTIIDEKEGPGYESVFHLTRGNHNIKIKYINGQCLDNEYLQKTYGTEAKPLSIYFAIRKKSDKQKIKNYIMFDNPIEIKSDSKPYKKIDLYLHCS